MSKATPAQIRKMYFLCSERGIDDETLHSHVCNLTGKESLKQLTISEAVKVIDSLSGKKTGVKGMMTESQKIFIYGLAKELGWITKECKTDEERLSAFVRERFKVAHWNWVTGYQASQIIEALKAMKSRKNKEDKKNEEINCP